MLDIAKSSHWWRNSLRSDNNVCVVAPRQSGKTTALLDIFIHTNDSLLFTPNLMMVRHTREMLKYNYPRSVYNRKASKIVNLSSINCFTPSYYLPEIAFIDEMSMCFGIYPSLERVFLYSTVVGVMTPTRSDNAEDLERTFNIKIIRYNDIPQNIDLFENEGDLFII